MPAVFTNALAMLSFRPSSVRNKSEGPARGHERGPVAAERKAEDYKE
jgi:hypothetical protein